MECEKAHHVPKMMIVRANGNVMTVNVATNFEEIKKIDVNWVDTAHSWYEDGFRWHPIKPNP